MGLPNSPVIGQKYRFGTLYAGEKKQPNPTRPRRPDMELAPGSGSGDIPEYSGGVIDIRDTDEGAEYQIQWVYCGKKNGRDFYIADRNILVSVPWDELDNYGLAAGKAQTIDGVSVKIVMPTGGEDVTETSGNDWNDYILNKPGVSGLITPSAKEAEYHAKFTAADYLEANNRLWNWAGCYSWCQERYRGERRYRALRGYRGAANFTYDGSWSMAVDFGFRPAVEV